MFNKSRAITTNKKTDLQVGFFVETEGIEPSSKRKANKFSTCLSSLRFSTPCKTEAIHTALIP